MNADKTLERSLALVHALHKRTRAGRVDWSEGPRKGVFECRLGAYNVQIREIEDFNDPENPDFQVDVYDGSDDWVESISNTSLRGMGDRLTEDGLNPYMVLKQTFQNARRQVRGVDQALDLILKALDEEDNQSRG